MICRTCLAAVRYGHRHGLPGWWHREDLDHEAFPIVEPEVVDEEPLPPVEVACHPVEPRDPLVPGGVRTITNLLSKQGWELRRLTHARGPYVGSKGKVLSISDTIVLGAREPETLGLDRPVRVAVASWRDGKFDFAYRGGILGGRLISTESANAVGLKNWIKGIE